VAGKVNSFLYVRNDDVAEVWINGVSQGSKPVDNNLPTDSTTLPFSIGVMVGNDNYRSALGFNALFFYGRRVGYITPAYDIPAHHITNDGFE
jgi:hypothetical protein